MPSSVEPADIADRLRRIEAVTDNALAELELEQLLAELLARVKELLGADTATVLLVDSGGHHLVASASSGMEEEVRQGVRVPVGEGFAGRIAASRTPMVIQQVDSTTVVNPLLWEKGVRSLAGVPLVAGGDMVGVLHVGTFDPTPFSERDVEFLQVVGDRVALATHTRLTRTERAAAAALQRTLLPAKLPQIAGLELSSRYVPGEAGGASGDWYDVFTLPSGWLCVTVGDVVGRGLAAATIMSRVRTATRSYALDSGEPTAVLSKLDAHIRHFEPQTMTTIAYAVLEPSLERMHISLAGHLSPVLALPDRKAELLDVPIDPPIGVGSAPLQRRSATIDLPEGATVLFYTDGLVERRDRGLDEGLRLLCDTVTTDSTERLCSTVMSRMVGSDPTDDDIAVLAIRKRLTDELRTLELELDAVPEVLADVRAALRRWLPTTGATAEETADLLVAVGEACSNVIEHAYGPLGGKINLRFEAEEPEVVVTVADTGRWRQARGAHRGRGTALMRQLSDNVTFEHTAGGTLVRIRKTLSGEPA
ncbi:ATP-binding SpoIIE family protein phosphatase [Prauserella cavernicola]|uniref:SpoIIE family protein phosphatase n=1 Tax=Prauserella cavernicola TaxID=2800127 RepID=A0A934QNG9_9PSEU|nr:SpoIIE family protein phosphatase [Prauserella cavernicola]MBK1785272.1 SpoIIE family protein phosphatase [Prauserella cavernicola]